MPNIEKTPPEIWMVHAHSDSGSNLWLVGGADEQQARDMVERNIGAAIIAIWPTSNTSHVAIGELRLVSEPAPLRPTVE